MADQSVFGEPITQEVLMTIPEYANKVRMDRSVVSTQWIDKDGKEDDVTEYVRSLKEEWGTGVSTLCRVYNGTGERLTFHLSHDWLGHIYKTYPPVIENGQWGGFLHVKPTGAAEGSEAAVVYRGKNKNGEDADWMLCWDNPWNRIPYDNKAYAEINRAGYFDNIDWKTIEDSMEGGGRQHTAKWEGCVAEVQTESDTSPIYEAKLYLSTQDT
ncbi:hypothetical protein HRI_001623300 [Hibiscus trionum]|uniref:23 kDa jasmonate-induced protein-like n=1 Tax=Hibiscus trionum TaxID=183268 RepID=A0A9W7HPD0_HIBTR|nr:hypothetical protein HRI_001623300 [Hibiscus trionum]